MAAHVNHGYLVMATWVGAGTEVRAQYLPAHWLMTQCYRQYMVLLIVYIQTCL